jgi:hypothetical protein
MFVVEQMAHKMVESPPFDIAPSYILFFSKHRGFFAKIRDPRSGGDVVLPYY